MPIKTPRLQCKSTQQSLPNFHLIVIDFSTPSLIGFFVGYFNDLLFNNLLVIGEAQGCKPTQTSPSKPCMGAC
jgi:hypothetical protein